MQQQIMQFIQGHTLLSVAWIGLFVAVIVTTYKSRFSPIKTVDNARATQLLNRENAIAVDIRSPEDYRKGHIVDSVNILPSAIKDNHVGELEKYKAQPVIVVCATGMTARSAAENLHKLGFSQVSVLSEGITGWSAAHMPLARGK
ncbi:MAG: rhodanese-like domain-containing protein [Plesiomonas sp.]|uniref:rhodanese-like domain-containing protein n=1 Tax=Plesiomonas sp. TaxID=2486279 RepID=UPI003F3B3AD0